MELKQAQRRRYRGDEFGILNRPYLIKNLNEMGW